MDRTAPACPRFEGGSERRDFFAEIVFAASETLLESPKHFVLFAVGKREIIIGELRIFLLQLAFDFVPIAFEFEFRHSKKES